MSKLAQAIKTRTGQGIMANRANGGNGGCAPLGTTPMSWGAGCPPGNCTSDQLAANLNRAFAGERYPCRELPYWLTGTADSNGDLTIEQNSRVTICPTRVVVMPEDGELIAGDAVMTDFEVGNQNQIVGDPIPLVQLSTFSYQIIPFVTDCIKAGIPFSMTFAGLADGQKVFIALIGPAIG